MRIPSSWFISVLTYKSVRAKKKFDVPGLHRMRTSESKADLIGLPPMRVNLHPVFAAQYSHDIYDGNTETG